MHCFHLQGEGRVLVLTYQTAQCHGPEFRTLNHLLFIKFEPLLFLIGACGSVVVKALRYKPEGCGFETQ
jgi:hypothetical protein